MKKKIIVIIIIILISMIAALYEKDIMSLSSNYDSDRYLLFSYLGSVYMEKIASATRGHFLVRLFSVSVYMGEK